MMKNSLLKTLGIVTVIFAMSACSGSSSSGESGATSSNEVKVELKAPEQTSRSYTYEEVTAEGYLAFKNKLQNFSSRIAEAYIQQEKDASESKEINQNLAISPVSVELCLGLVLSSASGETRNEILRAFGMNSGDYQTFKNYYHLYIDELSFEYPPSSLNQETLAKISFANSLWADKTLNLNETTLDSLANDYYCYSYQVDFQNNARKSNHEINKFVREKTDDFLSPQFDFPKETLLTLLNVIYLKDVWSDSESGLREVSGYSFTNHDGTVSNQKLLSGSYFSGKTIHTNAYSSFYTETKRGIRLYFIKANGQEKLDSLSTRDVFEHILDEDNIITKDDEKKEIYETSCVFPAFYANADIDLTKMLTDTFGINKLFTQGECDFSNLTSNSNFYCQNMVQNAKLSVDKMGIEGAAITTTYYGDPYRETDYTIVKDTFVVDKEFAYVITKGNSNDILFSGVITNID